MREFETTAVIFQHDTCRLLRQICFRNSMKVLRICCAMMVLGSIILGVSMGTWMGIAVALGFSALCALLILCWVGPRAAKRQAIGLFPDGDSQGAVTTWFEEDGLHTQDADGDISVLPLKRIRWMMRTGGTLMLATNQYGLSAIHMAQLDTASRQSVLDKLKAGCPKIKAITLQ